MAAILQTTFTNGFFNEKFRNRISLKFIPKGAIDSKSPLVQVMVWRRIVGKLIHEPMLTQFTDAYMRHLGR